MPYLIEDITAALFWSILAVVAVAVTIIIVAIHRRVSRRRYFQELELERQKAQQVVEPLYEKQVGLDVALPALRDFRSKTGRRALEGILLQHVKTRAELALTRQIVENLGWVQEWVDTVRFRSNKPSPGVAQLLVEMGDTYRPPGGSRRMRLYFQANFTGRCQAAKKLALIPTPQGLLAMVAGLADPHPDVQEVCLRHLGRLGDRETLPVLIEELIAVLEGRSPQSVRNVKTALVQFSLQDADCFRPALEHPRQRVRFFAADILREIVERHAATEVLSKNDFSPEIYRLFTERLPQDDWADVRARTAMVLGHFHDRESARILAKLLQDDVWFVRLHTCRSVGNKFFLALAPEVAKRLTDSHWLVREAATRTLLAMGEFGLEHTIRAFLEGEDRFAAEQICEELQRGGLLVEMLDNVRVESQRQQTVRVVRRMVSLGKISILLAYLRSPVPSEVKLLLMEEVTKSLTPECLDTLRQCFEEDPDPDVRDAAYAAYQNALATATTEAN